METTKMTVLPVLLVTLVIPAAARGAAGRDGTHHDTSVDGVEYAARDDWGGADERGPDAPARDRRGRRVGDDGKAADPDRHWEGGRFLDRLPAEERERLREFIAQYLPETARELQRLLETRPNLARRKLRRLLPELIALMRCRDEQPEPLFTLRLEAFRTKLTMQRIGQAFRRADKDQRERLREDLRFQVEKAFQIRQDIGRLEIERLEQGLRNLHDRVDHEAGRRDAIIARELRRRLAPGSPPSEPRDRPPAAPDSGGPMDRFPPADRPHAGNVPGAGPEEAEWSPDRPFIEQLPEEERRATRAFMGEYFPKAAKALERQLKKNPKAGERALRRLWPEMRRLMASREMDPEPLFVLKIQEVRVEMAIRRTQRTYDRLPDQKRERARDELRDLLERRFDLRHEIGRMEIERLQRGINRLQERLDEADRNRDEIIERQIERRLSPGSRG